MALSLFSAGFLLAAIPQLMQEKTTPLRASPSPRAADAAELALKGFLLARNRLPCPAASPLVADAAQENCALDSGFLPYKLLGLAQPVTNEQGHPFVYGVLGGTNHLGVASALYTPTYLTPGANYLSEAVQTQSNRVNGLDFCAKLRRQSLQAYAPGLLTLRHWSDRTDATKMRNPAWVLVDPGQRNADGNALAYPLFSSGNQPLAKLFESPGRPIDAGYDDTVSSASITQLYGELGCANLLAQASAATRASDVAFDIWRARSYLHDFRTYEHEVRQQKKVQAENNQLMQGFNLSMTVAGFALDFGIGLASASGAVSIAVTTVAGVTAVALASIGVADAVEAVAEAQEEVDEGQARVSQALQSKQAAESLRTARVSDVVQLDQRGWFP
jgi:hypothetical protein